MCKSLILGLGISAAALFATPLVASASDDNDACGAVLCLAGSLAGNSPGECSKYFKKYFDIVSIKNGVFKPNKTASKRLDFLNQCQSSDSATRNNINGKYGTQQFGF